MVAAYDKHKAQMVEGYTDCVYSRIRQFNPCCVLCFSYGRAKKYNSRKKKSPLVPIKAYCKMKECERFYKITINWNDFDVGAVVKCVGYGEN